MTTDGELWAARLWAEGVSHRRAGEPPGDVPMTVFWEDEVPVGCWFEGAFRERSSASPPHKPVDFSPLPSCSVVICTRDRPQELARCLASFEEQTLQPAEIVVVDNASRTLETKEAALAAGVRYVREDRPGLDIARNTGARTSTGDLIVYTDDDVVLHPSWLERLVGAFDAPQVWAATGLVLPAELRTSAQLHFERYWSFGRGYDRRDFGPEFFSVDRDRGCPAWELGAGANMAFRRETFARVGLFDERLDVGAAGCSGDSEMWHRVLAAGGEIRYEPSAVVLHYHRADWEGLSKQIRAYMSGHAAALLVQSELSGSRGSLKRALFTMPKWYARRGLSAASGRWRPSDALLREEATGYLSGLLYYVRSEKPGRPPQL
jgi:GT2 family glycosyltransferase